MLPPPITRPTWTPAFTTSAISAAVRFTTPGSMPNPCSPISASPLSLSRMRLYLSPVSGTAIGLLTARLSHHLFSEVLDLLLDTLAHGQAAETDYLGALVLQQLLDGGVGILDEGLAQQGHF